MSNIFSNKHFVERFSPTKTGGPALISGKTPGATPPKPSVPPGFSENGKTDTGQARPGRSMLGVLGNMVKSAGSAVLNSFVDDAKTLGNAFVRNAERGQGASKVSKEQAKTFDKDGDGTPFEKEDLAKLRKDPKPKPKQPAKKKPKTKKPFYVGKKPILTDAQKKKQAENAKNKG